MTFRGAGMRETHHPRAVLRYEPTHHQASWMGQLHTHSSYRRLSLNLECFLHIYPVSFVDLSGETGSIGTPEVLA